MKIKNNITITIFICIIGVFGIYFLSSKNNSKSSIFSQTSSCLENPNLIPNDNSSFFNKKDSWRQKEEQKDQIKQFKGINIIFKSQNMELQINNIEKEDIIQDNNLLERNQNIIGTHYTRKKKYLLKKQKTNNIKKIKNFYQEIERLIKENENIKTGIIKKQQTLTKLKDKLTKMAEYEIEYQKIEAKCQQQIQALGKI